MLTLNDAALLLKTLSEVTDVLRQLVDNCSFLEELKSQAHDLQSSLNAQSRLLKYVVGTQERVRLLGWISGLKHKQKRHDVRTAPLEGTGHWITLDSAFGTW